MKKLRSRAGLAEVGGSEVVVVGGSVVVVVASLAPARLAGPTAARSTRRNTTESHVDGRNRGLSNRGNLLQIRDGGRAGARIRCRKGLRTGVLDHRTEPSGKWPSMYAFVAAPNFIA